MIVQIFIPDLRDLLGKKMVIRQTSWTLAIGPASWRAAPLPRLPAGLQTPSLVVPEGSGSLRSPEVLGQGKCDKCWAAKGTWRADLGTALVGSNYNGYHVLSTYNYLYILPTSQLRSYSYYSHFIDQ